MNNPTGLFEVMRRENGIVHFVTAFSIILGAGVGAGAEELPPISQRDSIILIEGDEGRGSGFVVDVGGAQFIYTNAHVIGMPGKLKLQTMGGKEVKVGKLVEIAEDRDLARIPLKKPMTKHPFVFADGSAPVTIGSEVVAYGDSGGQGIITELKGKVLGVGPNEIEVNAEIIPGNSGGPIIEPGSLNVIAVSTRAVVSSSVVAKETRFEDVRRFGLKPIDVEKWKKTSASALAKETRQIEQLNIDTTSISAIKQLIPTRRGFYLMPKDERDKVKVEEETLDAQEWLRANRSKGFAKVLSSELSKINLRLGYGTTKPLKAMVETRKHYAAFFASVMRHYDNGVKGVKPERYSWANREAFIAAAEFRKKVATDINAYRSTVAGLIKNSPTLGR